MATLEKIRSKGVLLIVVVGIALLAFIVGDFLNSSSTFFNQSREIVASINGEEIKISEYSKEIEILTEVYKIETGQTELNDQMLVQLRSSVWENLLNEKILNSEAKKIGLSVSPEELSDRLIGNNIHPLITQRRAFAGENGQFSKANLIQFLNSLEQETENPEMRSQIATAKNYWLFWERTVKNSILQEKYNVLLSKSVSANSIDAKNNYQGNKVSVDVAYVMQPYYTISDSTVKATNDEIKSRYNKQKELYKTDANCVLNVVTFNILPLQYDYDEAQKWMDGLSAEFKTTDDVIGLVNGNSDIMYDGRNYTQKTIPTALKDFAFSGKTGDVIGPLFINNTHTMARIMQSGISLPDSVKLRHIFVPTANESKVDSIVKAIKDGGNFASLAKKYSAIEQTAVNGGEIGWLEDDGSASGEIKDITTAALTKAVNETFVIKNAQGTQILQVMEKTAPRNKVKIAILERKVEASKQTYSKIFNDAKQFASSGLSAENFEKEATKKGFMIRPANNVLSTTEKILDIPQSRQIVRWAFGTKKGTVSDIFDCGTQYAVVLASEVNKKGHTALEKVSDQIKAQLIQEKKAELIINNLAATLKKSQTLESLASSLNDSVRIAPAVNFSSYQFGTIGFEPSVIGKSSVLELNKVSAPIKGNAGVFVIRTSNKLDNPRPFDAKMEIMELNMRASYSLPYSIIQDLRDKTEITDNRLNFY